MLRTVGALLLCMLTSFACTACGGSCDDPGIRVCVRAVDATGATIQPDKLTLSEPGRGEIESFAPTERCESCCFHANLTDGSVTAEWHDEVISKDVSAAPRGCGEDSPTPVSTTVSFSDSE